MNCLESNSSETLANLVDKVNYKYEEMFSDIHFVDPSVKGPILGGPNYKAGTSLDWKTRTDVILSSHYNLHYGHCIQLDISPLSPKKNGKVLMSKGITFANMRLHVKTDQNMDMIFPSLFL